MHSSRFALAAAILSLACHMRPAISQDNPFTEFSVSGTFNNTDVKAHLSGWFIVNENNGMVVRANLFHGSSEFLTASAEAVSGDVFDLYSRNNAGDIQNLLFVAPANDGSLAGYTGGLICSNLHPICGGIQSSFFGGYISYDTEDLVYDGSVTKAGPVPMVRIAIKPHGEGPAHIDPRSHSHMTIAILSSRHFDAVTDVNAGFLTFGPTGSEQSITSCEKDGRDVNNDGIPDLICLFNPRLTQFLPSESLGILVGKTVQGSPFVGTERVEIKPLRDQR